MAVPTSETEINVSNSSNNRAATFIMLSGLLGGLLMTVLLAVARASALTPMNIESGFGALLINQTTPNAWMLGFGIHLGISMCMALIYGQIFKSLGVANLSIGAALGVAHWLLAGALAGLLPTLAPGLLMTSGEPVAIPGFFAINLGFFSVAFFMLLHLMFGAVVGSAYQQLAEEQPETLDRKPRKNSRELSGLGSGLGR